MVGHSAPGTMRGGRFTGGTMKRAIETIAWAIGSIGAVLWTLFWAFAMIYTHKFPRRALVAVGLGVFGAWEGFKMFRQVRSPN